MSKTSKIAVIIPFYQRTKGVLKKTIRAVLDQKGVDDFQLIAVDDSSPVSAREELAEFQEEAKGKIAIIEQPNKGAAGARNTGLASLSLDTEIVAFLDSDDVWTSDHLANAVFAIRQGYDFYISDFYQLGQTVTAFNRAGRINIADHPLIAGSEHIRHYNGDMLDQIITGNIIGTSVTAYAFSKMSDIRYRENFRHTGEEYLFWVDISLRTKKIAFSDQPECRYDEGVNIYSEPSWGQEKFLTIIMDEVKYRKILLDEYPITQAQRSFLNNKIRSLRYAFTAGLLNRTIGNKKLVDGVVLKKYLQIDNAYALMMWSIIVQIFIDKFANKAKTSDQV
ncbi:MAG: glycosyltransferase family A protein [Candidatus Methylumidiphilus sp.]